MADDRSARLDLPYLAAGQLQKHVPLNEALTRLDALIQTAVVSRVVADQPGDAAEGALYILPAGATGAAWAGKPVGTLMRFEAGGWSAVPVAEGMTAVVLDTPELLVRRGADWVALGATLGQVQNLSRLGLGTTADAVNPFAARLNKALWTAVETGSGGDGDLRLTFNKEGPADVLSLLFQSGYGGRAELGLIGDDDLSLKVSADGGTWRPAMAVERATGRVRFDAGATRAETTTITEDGGYAVPPWARWLDVVCVGGGGGGGSGAAGVSGLMRYGGGGGGAGGISTARWLTADLATTLSLTVGDGGSGGAAVGGGPGLSGTTGEVSTVSSGGAVILRGAGGAGGQGGTSGSGTGGAGGGGVPASNPGGASSVLSAGGEGEALARPDGPGGGGAGGGLSADDIARGGGDGGAGQVLGIATPGGARGVATSGQAGRAPVLAAFSWAGSGGGGGAAHAGVVGHAGGAGGTHGGGGGGGGGGVSGSGAGGAGGAGLVRITAVG